MPTKENGGYNFENGIKDRLAHLMHTIDWQLVCTSPAPRLAGPTQHEQAIHITRMIEYLRMNVSPLFLGEGQCVEHYLAQLWLGTHWRKLFTSSDNKSSHIIPQVFPEISFPYLDRKHRSVKPDLVGIDDQGVCYAIEIGSNTPKKSRVKKRGIREAVAVMGSYFPECRPIIPVFIGYEINSSGGKKTGNLTMEYLF